MEGRGGASHFHCVMLLLVALTLVQVCCGSTTILVGPTRTYTTPAAGIAAMGAGGTMIIDDGTYTTPFDIPQTLVGFTIMSRSGNPYKCILNGRGGVGSGYRLSNGKGIIHSQAPGTITGIGFINGGGGDNVSDGEAGLYAENFASYGILKVVNCSFDGNENGIFVPSGLPGGPGVNVRLEVYTSIFSKNVGNAVPTDGGSHNVYIQAKYFLSSGNIHFPSQHGNNLKSRALTTVVQDQYNKHNQGRCLDIPSGGQLTVTGGVYTSVGPTAVSNFFCYACENTNSGVYTPSISGLTIVGARTNDAIWNAVPVTVNFASTNQQWASSSASFNLIGSVTGITTSPPSGATFVSIPSPVLPPWAQ